MGGRSRVSPPKLLSGQHRERVDDNWNNVMQEQANRESTSPHNRSHASPPLHRCVALLPCQPASSSPAVGLSLPATERPAGVSSRTGVTLIWEARVTATAPEPATSYHRRRDDRITGHRRTTAECRRGRRRRLWWYIQLSARASLIPQSVATLQ